MRLENGRPEAGADQFPSLTTLILDAHQDERKRIARDLHDSTAQLIVALRLNLANLESLAPPEAMELIAEQQEIVDTLLKEIRTFSFLGHPPALEGRSLSEALRLFIAGYEARTGLRFETDIVVADDLAEELQCCIYRIVQEALANVHRHANATRVSVHISANKERVLLSIRDDGQNETLNSWDSGVGLDGMIERAEELGGTLKLHRHADGTMLMATLPLACGQR